MISGGWTSGGRRTAAEDVIHAASMMRRRGVHRRFETWRVAERAENEEANEVADMVECNGIRVRGPGTSPTLFPRSRSSIALRPKDDRPIS